MKGPTPRPERPRPKPDPVPATPTAPLCAPLGSQNGAVSSLQPPRPWRGWLLRPATAFFLGLFFLRNRKLGRGPHVPRVQAPPGAGQSGAGPQGIQLLAQLLPQGGHSRAQDSVHLGLVAWPNPGIAPTRVISPSRGHLHEGGTHSSIVCAWQAVALVLACLPPRPQPGQAHLAGRARRFQQRRGGQGCQGEPSRARPGGSSRHWPGYTGPFSVQGCWPARPPPRPLGGLRPSTPLGSGSRSGGQPTLVSGLSWAARSPPFQASQLYPHGA